MAVLVLMAAQSCHHTDSDSVRIGKDVSFSGTLSNQNVNVFFQDSKGYMWIGTDVGLNRFDGDSYLQFFNSPEDSTSLVHSKIYSIFEDSKERLWVGTRGGINRLRPDLTWDRFPMNSTSSNIFDIYENSRGDIFAGNRWSLLKFDPDSSLFKEVLFYVDYAVFHSKTRLDSSDDIWLIQDHKLVHYSGDSFVKLGEFPVDDAVIDSEMDDNDRIWLLHRHGIELFDTKMRRFEAAPQALSDPKLLSAGLKAVYRHRYGFDFISEDDVIYDYIAQSGIVKTFTGYTKEIITAYCLDKENISWIGFANKGYAQANNFGRLTSGETLIQKSLQGTSINAVSRGKDGNLWVLSDHSDLTVLDMGTDEVLSVDITKTFPSSSEKKTIINSVLADKLHKGKVWLLSGNVLHLSDLKGTALIPASSYNISEGKMRGLFEDSEGRVFVYGQGLYIYYLRPGERELGRIPIDKINLTQVTDMVQTLNGDIYFCCNYRQIFKIDFETGVSTNPLMYNYKNFEPTCMALDSEGRIWITANGSPIYRFAAEDSDISPVDFKASIYNNSILEQGPYMWIGSQNGLYRYEKASGKYNVFYSGDGIIGNQFNPHAACALGDGKLVFGGTGGITIFNPRYEASLPSDVSFPIETVEAGSSVYLGPENGKIILPPSENNVTIRYSALSHNSYLHLRYEYLIDGIDSDWHYVHDSRYAHYASLPYGHNHFRVRVVGPGRVPTGIERSLDIVIRRPWYISATAKLSGFLVFCLIAWLYIRMIKRNKEKEMEKELAVREKEQQKLLNEKNVDYFTSISHEFRTPLTMILGAADSIVRENKDESQYARILSRNVRRMQKLVDQLLDVSKLENGSLKLAVRCMDLLPKAKDITQAFTFSASSKGIDILFQCTEDSILGYLDEDAFEKILYNLLSNAIKYTPQGGTIEVRTDIISYDKAVDKFKVGSEDNYVRFKVIDSGVGIPEDKRDVIFNKFYQAQIGKSVGGTGIGLYFTKMLVGLHHGDIICEGRVDTGGHDIPGSQFTFILPLSEKSYTTQELSEPMPTVIKSNSSVLSEYAPVSTAETAEETQKPVILAIDDDPEILHYIKTLLSPYYKVALRFDASSGYEAIGQVSPDIIISDVLMLDIDGFEFCRMVKDNADYSHIPVILLTAKTSNEDQIKGIQAHADAYVTKPFEPDFLKELLKSLLDKKAQAMKVLAASTISTKDKLEEVLQERDREFMDAVYKFMEDELENEELNVTAIYEQMCMSRTKFYNKIKSLTGDSPGNFFRSYKLNRAKEILSTGQYKIAAVAIMTGFCSASHFSALFKKQFGLTPTEFLSGKEQ